MTSDEIKEVQKLHTDLDKMMTRLKCAKHCLDGYSEQQYQELLKQYDLKDIEGSL